MPCLALNNSSSERRKVVDGQRQELKIKIGDCMKVALLRAKLHSVTNGRSEILTVDLEAQKKENYVLQKEIQVVKDHPMKVNIPTVAAYL